MLSVSSNILHHGERITEDEELSPTLENVIVFMWLQLIHKDLPGLVKTKYGPDLRSKTLASIKPEISAALSSLLNELGSTAPVLRASTATRTNAPSSYPRPQQSYPPRPGTTNRPGIQRKPITCSICKNAGRPHNHFLSSCSLITPEDKKFLSRARLISALDDEMSQLDLDEESQFPHQPDPMIQQILHQPAMQPQSSRAMYDPNITLVDQATLPSIGRVTTCPSPYLNVFYHHSPIRFTVDTGATVNMIHEAIANQLGLDIVPSSQIATQADGKSEIEIIGETRFSVTRDNQPLHFEGLVARRMDTDVLAGIPFIAQNNISIHPAINVVKIGDRSYPYGNSKSKAALVHRVQTSIARSASSHESVWPGEYFEAFCDIDPH